MTETEFYGWQVSWYAVAALISFAAALLFWRKGAAVVGGKVPQVDASTWKLTGAAAIFVVVLGVLHFMNPLHPLSDYKRVLLVYDSQRQTSETSESASHIRKIQADVFKDAKIDLDRVVIELLPPDTVVLVLGLDKNSLTTPRPIPPGPYRARIIDGETGKFRDHMIEVPPK